MIMTCSLQHTLLFHRVFHWLSLLGHHMPCPAGDEGHSHLSMCGGVGGFPTGETRMTSCAAIMPHARGSVDGSMKTLGARIGLHAPSYAFLHVYMHMHRAQARTHRAHVHTHTHTCASCLHTFDNWLPRSMVGSEGAVLKSSLALPAYLARKPGTLDISCRESEHSMRGRKGKDYLARTFSPRQSQFKSTHSFL